MRLRFSKYFLLTLLLPGFLSLRAEEIHAQQKTADSLVHIVQSSSADTTKIRALLTLSRLYDQSDAVQKYKYANEALQRAVSAKWKTGELYAERLLGESFSTVKLFPDAIIHFNRCIALATQLQDEKMIRACLQYLVHCYDHNSNKPMALICQGKLTELYEKSDNRLEYVHQMWAYANLLSESRREEEGIAYMKKAVATAEQSFTGRQRNIVVAEQLNNLGRMYAQVGKADSAISQLHLALQTLDVIRDTIARVYVTATLCNVYASSTPRNQDSLMSYASQTIRRAEQIHDNWILRNYYPLLAEAFEHRGDLAKALRYHKLGDSLAADMDKTQKTQDEAAKIAQLNFQQQIGKSRLEQRAAEERIRFQRAGLLVSICFVILLIFILLYIFRNLKQKSRTNRLIAAQAESLLEQNRIIDEALKTKEVLLSETHHRVKNNLQLVNSLMELQLANLKTVEARTALSSMQQRVHSIALVHGKLYGEENSAAVEFGSFVKELFDSLQIAFGGKERPVHLVCNIGDAVFGIGVLIPLGLIINELITNSFKHAFGHQAELIIGIELIKQNDDYTLHYSDNGPGLPPGVFETNENTMGLYLIKRLSKQLKGKATYEFSGKSIFTITFRHEGN